MVNQREIIEVEIDGRTFWVLPVGEWVLQSNNVVTAALAESLGKPLPWAVGNVKNTNVLAELLPVSPVLSIGRLGNMWT